MFHLMLSYFRSVFVDPAAGGGANAHAPCGFFGSRALAGTFLPRSERADQGGVAKWWNGLSPSAVEKNIHHYESHNDIMLYTYPYNHMYISLYSPSSVPSWSSPAYIRIDRGWGDSTIWAQHSPGGPKKAEGSGSEGGRWWCHGPLARPEEWWCVQGFIPGFGNMEVLKDLFDRKGDVWWIPSRPSHFWMMRGKEQETTKYFPSTTFKHILVGGLEHEFYLPFHIWVVILPIDELIFFKMGILHHQPVDSPLNQSDESSNFRTSLRMAKNQKYLTPDETKLNHGLWKLGGYSSNSQTSSHTFFMVPSHLNSCKRGLLIQGWHYGKHDQPWYLCFLCGIQTLALRDFFATSTAINTQGTVMSTCGRC